MFVFPLIAVSYDMLYKLKLLLYGQLMCLLLLWQFCLISGPLCPLYSTAASQKQVFSPCTLFKFPTRFMVTRNNLAICTSTLKPDFDRATFPVGSQSKTASGSFCSNSDPPIKKLAVLVQMYHRLHRERRMCLGSPWGTIVLLLSGLFCYIRGIDVKCLSPKCLALISMNMPTIPTAINCCLSFFWQMYLL